MSFWWSCWQVNIGSCNGLVPSGTKPLSDLKLTQIYNAIWLHQVKISYEVWNQQSQTSYIYILYIYIAASVCSMQSIPPLLSHVKKSWYVTLSQLINFYLMISLVHLKYENTNLPFSKITFKILLKLVAQKWHYFWSCTRLMMINRIHDYSHLEVSCIMSNSQFGLDHETVLHTLTFNFILIVHMNIAEFNYS